jgi:hypothetical protein
MAVTQALVFTKNLRTKMVPTIPFPSFVNHHAVTTAETETVPAGAYSVVIKTDATIWLSDGTAVVPAGDVVDGAGSFPLGAGEAICFDVVPGQTISVISASGTANVAFLYYGRDTAA